MMSDNAAVRLNYVSELYQFGVEKGKKDTLASLGKNVLDLHNNGLLHIHDLEAYGKVYNCCVPEMLDYLKSRKYNSATQSGKIFELFEHIKGLIVNLAVNQSGGIGFSNFDIDVAEALEWLDINFNVDNIECLKDCIRCFVEWVNVTYTRYCREPYYLTLNIGLAISDWGRSISELLISSFENSPIVYMRPNIVFKVNRKINGFGTKNFEIYKKALMCTAKRMIPTYLLTDSRVNDKCIPEKLAIMGCRTRVYDNINGSVGSIGRGNIACVSVNLPRVALQSSDIEDFNRKLDILMNEAKEILLHRVDELEKNATKYLNFVFGHSLWGTDKITDLKKRGTLSIGFIGLSECVEVLTGYKPYQAASSYNTSLEIIKFMREKTNEYRESEKLNFSLLASPGEMLATKFCSLDSKYYSHDIQQKGFYTNSFHVNVDAGVSIYKKIELEAPFHELCNGGCITYIELSAAPLTNWESLDDGINYAVDEGISYLGFNFPYDICNKCGNLGTFDTCDNCGSNDIKRIRRVSGYLEEISYFTEGKRAEAEQRKANI